MVRLSQLTAQRLRENPAKPEVLELEGEMSDRVFDALGSETTRKILTLLYETPRTPSELSHETGTTLQNVTYHINKLRDADLIEPVRSHYSEKGRSVISYGPTREAVVVVAGPNSVRQRLKDMLARVVVLFLVLGVTTAIVWNVVRRVISPPPISRTDMETVALDASDPIIYSFGHEAAFHAALTFFAGGTFIIVLVSLWWLFKNNRDAITSD